MNPQILLNFPSFSLLLILLLLGFLKIQRCSANPEWYKACGTTFNCGTITGIGYPFRGNGNPEYCGYPGLVLNCNKDNNITTIQITNIVYRVLGIDQTMRIAREDVMETNCPQDLVNTTLDYTLFDFASTYMNLTFFYGCPLSISIPGFDPSPFSCGGVGKNEVYVLPGALGPGICNASVIVPVMTMGSGGSVNVMGWDQVLREGFEVTWKVDGKACSDCTGSNGRCGYDFANNRTTCYCPDPPYVSDTCSTATGDSSVSTASPGPGTFSFF